jgi:hypothetical protein
MPFQPLQRFNGLLDRMVPQDNYGGLLSPQDQRAAANAYRAQLASGLLSAAGPQRMPVSLGQAIGSAMPQAAQARDYRAETGIRNEQLRRQIDNENKQNAARAKFSGLLRTAGGEDGEALGLLADIDPQLAVAVMTSQGGTQAQDPADIEKMRLLGIPLNEAGYARLKELENDGSLDGLNLQIQGLQLANMQREQKEAEQKARETRVAQEQGIVRGLDQTQKIASLTKKLEGTALASGLPAAEWRRAGVGGLSAIKGVLGLDTDEMRAELAAFDEQKKNLSDQLNNLIAAGQLDNVTDSKLRQYQNSLADQNTQPAAIMEIQSVISQAYLDQADRIGYEIPNREEYEAAMEEMRNYVPPGTETVIDAPAIGRRVSEIGRMSAEQLNALATSGVEMTEEMIDAAEARWNQINAR